MEAANKQSHLTFGDRQIIQKGIENGSSKKTMADLLGKDKSTIGKEILQSAKRLSCTGSLHTSAGFLLNVPPMHIAGSTGSSQFNARAMFNSPVPEEIVPRGLQRVLEIQQLSI